MRKVLFAVICAAMLFGMVAMSSAEREDWRGGIRTRIHDARESIERGIKRGTLTHHEARGLKDELTGILNKIDRMKEDGHLSQRERENINRDLDRLERHIAREKHDDDTEADMMIA